MRPPPPDKRGQQSLSVQDIESSNATLNAFFPRQKSWMTGGGAPVHPTPRATVPRASSTSQKAAAAVLPSPAPSNEPSPILTNSPMVENHRASRAQTHGNDSRQPSTTPPVHFQNQSEPVGNQSPHQTAPPTQISHENYGNQLGEPNPHSTAAAGPQQSTPRNDNPAALPSLILPQDTSRSQLPPSINSPILPAQSVAGSPTYGGVVPTPNLNGSGSAPYSNNTSINSNRRQRNQVATMPSLKPRIALIEAHIAEVGGPMNLNAGLERPRFELLAEACRNEDSFYVALHQIFNLWDFDRNILASIPNFPPLHILQEAFRVTAQMIKPNGALAPNHSRWFASFPSPLPDLLRTSKPWQNTVESVKIFLVKLTTDWGALSNLCETRKFPPLVDELVERLGLLSPILQGVMTTAIRRNLGIPDGPIGNKMQQVFMSDQHGHQAFCARWQTSRPPSLTELEERNRRVIFEYQEILKERRNNGPAAAYTAISEQSRGTHHQGSPSLGSTTPLMSTTPVMQQGTWQQNIADPPQIQNPGSANPGYHGPSRTVGGPSNQESVSTGTASGATQRLNINTLGSNVPQGYPMRSPLQGEFQAADQPWAQPQYNNQNVTAQQNSPTNYQLPPINGNPQAQQAQANILRQQQQQQVMTAQQQQQAMAAQQQILAGTQQIQWQQNLYQNQPQAFPYVQPHNQYSPQLQQRQIQQQRQHQHQQAFMNQQHQQAQIQQVLNLNRAVHSRRSSGAATTVLQQGPPSRGNSISSNGPRLPTTISSAVSGARPAISSVPGQGRIPSTGRPGEPFNAQPQMHNMRHPQALPLFPRDPYFSRSQPPRPEVSTLHQAHLRSPRLVCIDVEAPETAPDNPSLKRYQAVKSFAVPPTKINSASPLSKYEFSVLEEDISQIPEDILSTQGQLAIRKVAQGTLQYRLRCIKLGKLQMECSPPEWVIRDTDWPEGAALQINKLPLEIRRKHHHGKDLPIDITQFVRLAGSASSTRITCSIPSRKLNFKEFNYFLAVEIIEVLTHDQILEMCEQKRIPVHETLDGIKKSLAGPADDDEELAMVSSDLSLDLADPFSAKIFDIPVRGTSCLHRECFDLKLFLQTRHPKRPHQPTMVDVWKCPLCGQDARPRSLVIDDFMLSVRKRLGNDGRLDCKTILIAPDGSWRPKNSKRTASPDDSDGSDGDEMHQPNHHTHKRVREVIELDDD